MFHVKKVVAETENHIALLATEDLRAWIYRTWLSIYTP